MQIGRRPVLQGLAATGMTVVTGSLRAAEGHSQDNLASCLVMTEQALGDAFLAGVRSVFAGEVAQETASLDLESLNRPFGSRKSRLLLGLVDDGVAAIMMEMSRDAGSRLRWLGQHTMLAGHSHHRLLTASNESGGLFAQVLQAGAAPSVVTTCTLEGGDEEFSVSGQVGLTPRADRWAVALGAGLASMCAGGGGCYRSPPQPAPAATGGADAGSLVSFGFEL